MSDNDIEGLRQLFEAQPHTPEARDTRIGAAVRQRYRAARIPFNAETTQRMNDEIRNVWNVLGLEPSEASRGGYLEQPPLPSPVQKELPGVARVDPSWTHQDLIPGLPPLTEAEGRIMRARRLGLKTRVLRQGDPAMNRDAVMAFYQGARDNPAMFEYGLDPVRTGELRPGASLEDYAQVYGERLNAQQRAKGEPEYHDPLQVERSYGEDPRDDSENWEYPEPEPLRHGRGEAMRDEYGDYIQEKKKHERGDVPVYDEAGDVKKVTVGFDPDEGPKKEKYVARGGELMRESGRFGGSPKYRFVEARGGELKRDERGDIKYEDPDNLEPEYVGPEDGGDEGTAKLTAPKGGEITVSGLESGNPAEVDALSNRGPYGTLLYQMLNNQAAHGGYKITTGGLTDVNRLRLLTNANINYARTGKSPRSVSNTAFGTLPQDARATGYAEGPEIWRAESDEALRRATRHGGEPQHLSFDPDAGFLLDSEPATPAQIRAAVLRMSPEPKESGVGEKTLLRSAVFDWVRDADPVMAEKVAREWPAERGPLFLHGKAGKYQEVLREQAKGALKSAAADALQRKDDNE